MCEVCVSPVQNPDSQAKRCMDCRSVKQQVGYVGHAVVDAEDHPPPHLQDWSRCRKRSCKKRLKAHNRSGYCKDHRPKKPAPPRSRKHLEDTMQDAQHPNPEARLPIPGTAAAAGTNGATPPAAEPAGSPQNAGNGPPKRAKAKGQGKAAKGAKRAKGAAPGTQKAKNPGPANGEPLMAALAQLTPSGPSLHAVENLEKHLNAKAAEFENAAKTIRAQAVKLAAVRDALAKLSA